MEKQFLGAIAFVIQLTNFDKQFMVLYLILERSPCLPLKSSANFSLYSVQFSQIKKFKSLAFKRSLFFGVL